MERSSMQEAGSEDLIRYAEAVQDRSKDRDQLVHDYDHAITARQHKRDDIHRLEQTIYALRESLRPYLLEATDAEPDKCVLNDALAPFPAGLEKSLDLFNVHIETRKKLWQELSELEKRVLALEAKLDESNALPGQRQAMPEA